MRDKIVVTIEPASPADQLDVADAFEQVLDYLQLVELAASDSAHFDWKLASASTNSPFTVVAFTQLAGRPRKLRRAFRSLKGVRKMV